MEPVEDDMDEPVINTIDPLDLSVDAIVVINVLESPYKDNEPVLFTPDDMPAFNKIDPPDMSDPPDSSNEPP